jgi:hypothetical protein
MTSKPIEDQLTFEGEIHILGKHELFSVGTSSLKNNSGSQSQNQGEWSQGIPQRL